MNYLYFASGATREPDVLGFADINHPVGVVVSELNAGSVSALLSLAGSDLKIFIDSGAFSEVQIKNKVIKVVRPITEADWRERLAAYRDLAYDLGPQLHVVAPDMVGNQYLTLVRLKRHLEELRQISELKATILVPLQRGDMSQAEMHYIVAEMMEGIDWMPALPCKKAATSAEEILTYCATVKPERVHLLGAGPKSDVVLEVLSTIRATSAVQMDSCLIRSTSGWTNGRNNGPRVLTIAQAIAVAAGYKFSESRQISIAMAFGGNTNQLWTYQAAVMSTPRGSLVESPTCAVNDSRYLTAVLDHDQVATEFLQTHHGGRYPAACLYVGLWSLDRLELIGVAVFGGPPNPLTFILLPSIPGTLELWFLAQCYRNVELRMAHRRVALLTPPHRVIVSATHPVPHQATVSYGAEPAYERPPCPSSSMPPSPQAR